ncbi:hypothetical protein [Promicromonospora iranensis]|uniref:Htaa protein n=1 Tax=Promicromonospora iranensis TaxID=1105144 RepID=A0ABU2CNT9_9MICO|nr:hypothetical protein [Promicromonospora iranensis]MDR7382951.1 hypothetical protein [Promicromonospora iranensis]
MTAAFPAAAEPGAAEVLTSSGEGGDIPSSSWLAVGSVSGLVHGGTGSVQVRVASYGQVDEAGGEILARIDGVEVGRGAASLTLQPLPIDLSNIVPGRRDLELSYTGSDRLEPSSVTTSVAVALGQFEADMPAIVGTARVGETLVADPRTWTPLPSSTTYVWRVDGEVLPGENGSKLVVPRSAFGKKISVVVTGARANYATTSSGSNRTSKVGGIFVVSKSPSVSGTTRVGSTLKAAYGTWAPVPEAVKYQWRLDGRAVLGATSRTWKLPPSARSKRVTVAVTGVKTQYLAKTVASAATATIKPGILVAPRPTITGTTKVGATLKAVRGTWSPQPSTVKYQWKVGGVAVRGATSYWFKVPASAKGKRVAVVVTGSRTGYVTKTVTSPLTSAVR